MKNPFWWVRLKGQTLLFWVCFLFKKGGASHLIQTCERCGQSGNKWPAWWDDTGQVWNEVVGQYHGCYCPYCFTDVARCKGIFIEWKPKIHHVTSTDVEISRLPGEQFPKAESSGRWPQPWDRDEERTITSHPD